MKIDIKGNRKEDQELECAESPYLKPKKIKTK